jgi:hypothetical protein
MVKVLIFYEYEREQSQKEGNWRRIASSNPCPSTAHMRK